MWVRFLPELLGQDISSPCLRSIHIDNIGPQNIFVFKAGCCGNMNFS